MILFWKWRSKVTDFDQKSTNPSIGPRGQKDKNSLTKILITELATSFWQQTNIKYNLIQYSIHIKGF